MKKFFAVVSLLCAGYNVAEAQSMLKVSLSDNSQITVSLDDRYFNKRGSSVTVGDLPAGRHYLEIFTTTQDSRGRVQEQIVYEGKIKTYDGAITLFQYDPSNNQKYVQQQDMNTYTASNYPQNGGAPGGQMDNNEQAPPPSGNYDNSNNGGGYDNGNNGEVASPVATPTSSLTEEKADKLKTTVEKKATDTEKLKALKDGLKGETLTTDQVSGMMDWFDFESSRVDFAKWAYSSVVDKENYKSLENKFSYKASQDELDNFIGK